MLVVKAFSSLFTSCSFGSITNLGNHLSNIRQSGIEKSNAEMNIFIVNVNVVLSYNLIFIYLLSAEPLKLSINIIQFSQLYYLKHFYVKNLQILATIFNFYVSNFNRTFASSFQGYRKDKSLVFCILWSLNQHKTRQPLNVYTLRLLKGGVVMLYCLLYTRMEILEYNL